MSRQSTLPEDSLQQVKDKSTLPENSLQLVRTNTDFLLLCDISEHLLIWR